MAWSRSHGGTRHHLQQHPGTCRRNLQETLPGRENPPPGQRRDQQEDLAGFFLFLLLLFFPLFLLT